ncbi:MAG: hypothetical protein KBD66_03155, partial [Candidatus Doudnabacteria bacterium]|nr:hypothetical protein [Candidatus Doudnabacteria bacterium]
MIERTGSYFTNELASPKRPESLSVEEIQRIDLRIQGLLVSGVDLASVARQIGAGRFVYEDKGKTGLQTTRFDVAEYKASLSMQGSVPVWLPATVIRTEVEILPATGDLPDSGIEKFVPAQLVPKRKLFGELVSQLDSSYVLVSFVGKGSARVSPDRYSLFYLPTYKAAVMLSGSSSDSTYVLGGVSTLEQAMEYQRYDKAVLQRLLPNNVTAVENSLSGKLLSGDGTADAVRRLWDDWGQDWQLRLKEAICQEFPPLVSDIVPVFQESGTQSGYSTNALAKELGVAFEVVDSRVRALEAQGKRVGAFEQTDRGALFILSRQAVEHIREAVVLPERLRNWVPEVELRNELEVSQKVLLDYLDGLASSLDAPAYEMRIDPIFSKLRTVFIDPKIVPVVREHFQKPGPGFRVLGQVLDEIGVDTKVFRRIMAS